MKITTLVDSTHPLSGDLVQKSPYAVDDELTVDSFLRSLGLDKYAIFFKAEEDLETKQIIDKGTLDNGLYVLKSPLLVPRFTSGVHDLYIRHLLQLPVYHHVPRLRIRLLSSLICRLRFVKVFEALAHCGWQEAMKEEILVLERNNTLDLVPLPSDKKTIGCKWVFTIKMNPNESIARLKAQLVAKGYAYTYGIDYFDTFSPVAKHVWFGCLYLWLSLTTGLSINLMIKLLS